MHRLDDAIAKDGLWDDIVCHSSVVSCSIWDEQWVLVECEAMNFF